MRIDSSHKKWIIGTGVAAVLAVALYVWLDKLTLGGVTGGSKVGLIYALVGAALMIFAGLLAAHRKLLRWAWIPRRSWWLKGHIWLGLLSGVIIFCHSGFGWGGSFERVLWAVFALTLGTGILGVLLQHYLPGRLTAQIVDEVPYEQIPHLCQQLRRQCDTLVASICGSGLEGKDAGAVRVAAPDRQQLRDFYENKVRPFLSDTYDPAANPVDRREDFAWIATLPGLAPVRQQVEELRSLCDERRQLGERERLYHWLHGWLIVHVPLSVGLLILGVAHAVVASYY